MIESNQEHTLNITDYLFQASSVLLDLLRSKFKLMEHFKTVRMFFLMEAGPTIHYITSDIFQRVSPFLDYK